MKQLELAVKIENLLNSGDLVRATMWQEEFEARFDEEYSDFYLKHKQLIIEEMRKCA